MPNEYVIKNGYLSQGNSNITGSLEVSGGITGSLLGTASLALTSSYATRSEIDYGKTYVFSNSQTFF